MRRAAEHRKDVVKAMLDADVQCVLGFDVVQGKGLSAARETQVAIGCIVDSVSCPQIKLLNSPAIGKIGTR